MVDVVLSTDELTVLGGPDQIEVQLDFGPDGKRGSLIFVGNGNPNIVDIGQDPNIFDLYINLNPTDVNNEYLMIYQYIESLGTIQWQPLTKLMPNVYNDNISIDFTTAPYCFIPISKIVDPSYSGNQDASNFSVQATFSSSAGYPIANSIKTERIEAIGDDPVQLKITFYAKEFKDGSWVDIDGSRTANISISVV